MVVEDFVDMRQVQHVQYFCAAMGIADMHVRYVNRRVLGNIEATNATRGHIDRYTNIPRDVGRYHDQCGARSGSPQLYTDPNA